MGKTRIVRQLRNGQLTIPKEFRDALALKDDDMLAVTLQAGSLNIAPVKAAHRPGGSAWARELYEAFAPVRESLEGYTEQEINDAIDEAIRAVRRDANAEK